MNYNAGTLFNKVEDEVDYKDQKSLHAQMCAGNARTML
jgi:hypothetical protein